ncbi:dTMP kinase [Phenylobacterium immobile]|uniref:dTMP kinase n=1 Tax=Phenylobacterium immobile TaxID=21 RepID=UPI000AE8B77E|nr:dTMP kinase [Phenylobacterium immobile]
MARGRFITFEGGEGAGKSTQLRRLIARLRAQGLNALATREPGGSAGAEQIRDLVLRGAADRWSAISETLLMYAARRDHIERVIEPGLSQGAWVICDRFADSTRAYQGGPAGAPPGLIAALETHVLQGTTPDLTLVLDLPAEMGLARAEARAGAEMRFESKGLAFHQNLRDAFMAIAAAEPERCAVIDAAGDLDAVESAVWSAVSTRLDLG